MRERREEDERDAREPAATQADPAAAPPPPSLIALQRSAGNAAVTRMLARVTDNEKAREEHPIKAWIDDVVNATDDRAADDPGTGPIDEAMEWLANETGTPDDQPVKRELLAHYARGSGPFKLTLEQMELMASHFDLFAPAYSAAMAPFINQVEQTGQPVVVSARVRGQNSELGNFEVLVEGTLYPRDQAPKGVPPGRPHPLAGMKVFAPDGPAMRFQGKMSWYDFWDFDSKLALQSDRPAPAEFAVIAVRLLINGRPFPVFSEWVDVAQDSGELPLW